jgi:hypothetical protein
LAGSINIKEFEHLFSEVALKKGLSLIKNNCLTVSSESTRGKYLFSFNDKSNTTLMLTRLGDKIISFNCSSHKHKCEHLCAAAFYFQSALLNNLFTNGQRKKTIEDRFKKASRLIRKRIKETNLSIAEDAKSLLSQLNADKTLEGRLALLNELSTNEKIKSIIGKTQADKLIAGIKSAVLKNLKKDLSISEKDILFSACAHSFSNSRLFETRLFSFYMPYCARHITSKSKLEELKVLLNKRELKHRFPGEADVKLVSKYHLERLTGTAQGIKTKNETNAEFFISETEFDFAKGHIVKAFKKLDKGLVELKALKPATLLNYLEFCIERAAEYKDLVKEMSYIREWIIYSPHLNKHYLKRIKNNLSEEALVRFTDEVIGELKTSVHDNFEKISELLLTSKRYDDLVKIISKQQNKFRLLNEIAIKKFPDYDDYLFSIYVKQFQSAINSALETHYQKQILENALQYINKLPKKSRIELLSALSEVTGRNSYIRKCLLDLISLQA